MKKTILFAFALSMVLPALANARDYGDAGCGLGSMLFHKDSQVLAATTNGTSANQIFGISSGTSNCVDEGTVRAEMKVKMFIEANKLALAKDISRGQGESLATLTKLLDCSGAAAGPALQKNYGTIFPNSSVSPESVGESIRATLRKNAVQCSYLG